MNLSLPFSREGRETPEDRAAELVIAERFRAATGAAKVEQLQQYSPLDYLATWPDGRTAWLEVKRCRSTIAATPQFYVEMKKWVAGRSWAESTDSRFIVVVEFLDGDRACVINRDDVHDGIVRPTTWKKDIPAVSIPQQKFRTFAAVGLNYGHRPTPPVAAAQPPKMRAVTTLPLFMEEFFSRR